MPAPTITPTPAAVPDGLISTLEQLVRSQSGANPAFEALVDDYASYHLVLAVVGGAFAVVLAAFAWVAWKRFRRARDVGSRRWTFPAVTYLVASAAAAAVVLLLAVVVAANVTTALDPRPAFAGAIGLVGAPAAGSPRAELHDAFDRWLRSGDAAVPPAVQSAVDRRIAWQRPKAIVSGVLLLVVVVLAAGIWRPLLDPGRAGRRSRRRDGVRVGTGLAAVAAALVLMLMVMGNTQASVAPVAMTLFYG